MEWKCMTQPYAGEVINNAREKYGLDSFDFEILKECDDKELDFWEKYYIKELNTKVPYGYNLTEGGDGCKGYHHTEEAKEKNRQTHLGKKMPPFTEEHKRKLKESAKGRKPSELCRIRQIEAVKGKKRSPEAIRKSAEGHIGHKHRKDSIKRMSEAAKGKYKGIYNTKISKPVFQINKNTNQIIREFPSLSQITRDLGYSIGNISQCCNGERKSAYGYIWRYKEDAA